MIYKNILPLLFFISKIIYHLFIIYLYLSYILFIIANISIG